MKKIYFLFLMTLLPLLASAETAEINGIYYNLVKKAKTAEVTRNPNTSTYSGSYSGKVVIPKTITYEGIKYSVISIGGDAFSYCFSRLTSVTVPNSVTSIGYAAFEYCTGLTSVTIPNSVTSIGGAAFSNCSGLTSVTIPNSVTSIGGSAFSGCSGLTSVHITSLEAWCKISFIDVASNPLLYAHHLFMNGTEIKDLVIPNSVTSIGSSAFYDCSGLTSITIPSGVTSIGNGAFFVCSGLKSIIVDNGNTVYDSREGCNAIIRTSDNELIQGCKKTIIPNSVTSIGSNAFSGCSGLTSVTIPNSVTSIGDNAFWGCSKLKTVKIGKGIQNINYYAFGECEELTDVYCYAENIPNISDAFNGSYIEYATLHVPVGSMDAYKAAEPWSGFKSIVKIASKVSLNKSEVTMGKGETVTLKATVTPSTLLDKSVTWKSSNKKVATVTGNGEVKGIKAGTATITCTSKVSGTKATCKVTIIDGNVSLDKKEVTLEKGSTVTLKATVYPETLEDKSVTWTSSDKKVATVTTKGKVKGIAAGTATITCTSNATGLSATCNVTVINGTVTLNKTEAIIEKGKTTTLKATLTPTTLEDMSVTWTSSDKSIATVTSKGKVKGVGYGTATITCTSNATGVSATCQVTVGKVVINISEVTLKKTRTMSLKATVYPITVTDKSVTWKSSDTKVATVTSSGKVKGIAAGTATITCTSVATGLKGTCTVTVLATSESRSVEGDDDTTGIENLEEAPALAEPYDVYDLSGRKVLNQTTTLDGLPAGIYIVNGKKVLKK